MARRRKARRMRRRPKQFSILDGIGAYAQGNLFTQKLFGADPISFLVGDVGAGFSTSGGTSLIELVKDPKRLEGIAKSNLNLETVATLAIQSAILNFGFKTAKRMLRQPINSVNRLVFKPLALGVKM